MKGWKKGVKQITLEEPNSACKEIYLSWSGALGVVALSLTLKFTYSFELVVGHRETNDAERNICYDENHYQRIVFP